MTFCPSIISSIKPLTSPKAFCCPAKYRREREPMVFTTSSMTARVAKVTRVSVGLRTSIMTMVPVKFSVQEMRLPKLLFKASETVSMSLV